MSQQPIYILAIESSCDDTSAAVLCNDEVRSNIVANQDIHRQYGGVVPELASRSHQANIVPVVHQALATANITKNQLHAVAFTQGPGLLGSLLVGSSFAKSLALGLSIPLISVHHMEAHILAHFIQNSNQEGYGPPQFPFLCLTVSGGHTQIVKVTDTNQFEILGETIDDAAGEAFDKAAKIMGLPYPGGPLIDKLAQSGNPKAFTFPAPSVQGLNFSFSGLKTALLYFLQAQTKQNPQFIEMNQADICASFQHVIVTTLLQKLATAAAEHNITHIALAGGVSANSGLRLQLREMAQQKGWKIYIPKMEYCTDNAAMIGITAYFKYQRKQFESLDATALARFSMT